MQSDDIRILNACIVPILRTESLSYCYRRLLICPQEIELSIREFQGNDLFEDCSVGSTSAKVPEYETVKLQYGQERSFTNLLTNTVVSLR